MDNLTDNSPPVNLEDDPEDIIQKAARGLGKGKRELMEESGLSMLEIESFLNGNFNEFVAYKLAECLNLKPDALIAIGQRLYRPEVNLPSSIHFINRPYPVPGYEKMTVNSFIIEIPQSNEIILFDCGENFHFVQDYLKSTDKVLSALYITHRHPDHISHLKKFKDEYQKLKIASNSNDLFTHGSIEIKSVRTPGHSQDGTSYIIKGLGCPIVIVGDAIFAGSIGGIKTNYKEHLITLSEFLESLPDEYLLLPGHGPCTSAKLEKKSNPFFP